jgi:RNA polymerase sigma-70 factor, ECF subfamily
MIGAALERVFREANGRIVAALASRFRNLALAEDAFSEACSRALATWPSTQVPRDPAAWLYQVSVRIGLDTLRRRKTAERFGPQLWTEHATDIAANYDEELIPDERLRLIFICCHPAINVEARAALTLRLVCGLSTTEIARAFFVSEATLQQRLVRAKRKIAEAAIPFEVPGPSDWPDRLDAVLSTLEIAYAKAYEDAAGRGPHAGYAAEILHLSKTLMQLLPNDAEVWALAALVRFTEARRRARLDKNGLMIPLSEQDPAAWDQVLIEEGMPYLQRAMALDETRPRVLQAQIHAVWCSRSGLAELPPWPRVLAVYDRMLAKRDDPVVRLNRAVALAEIAGIPAALAEVDALDARLFGESVAYHSVRADLLRRTGRYDEARRAYDAAITLITTPAERAWMIRRRNELGQSFQNPLNRSRLNSV